MNEDTDVMIESSSMSALPPANKHGIASVLRKQYSEESVTSTASTPVGEDVLTTTTITSSSHETSQLQPLKQQDLNAVILLENSSPPILAWSESLKSPQDRHVFSPALDANKPDSLFGWGLHMASDRGLRLTRCGRRVSALLMDVTSLYDAYAQALLRACQGLTPILGQANALSIQETLISISGETSKLSATMRTDVAQPMSSLFTIHAETIQGMQERVLQCRQRAHQSRNKAINARRRYIKLLRETEQAIAEWSDKVVEEDKGPVVSHDVFEAAQNNHTGGNGANATAKPSKRVLNKLKELQRQKSRYKRFVEWENEGVKQCLRMECMALETLQKLEQDRLVLFVHSLTKILHAQKTALQEMSITLPEPTDTANGSSDSVASEDRKGRKALVKLLKPIGNGSFHFEENTGVMDAETVGLPEEIGRLRDTVLRKLSARSSRIQAVRILAGFLEQVAGAAHKLGTGLKLLLQKEEIKGISFDSVLLEIKKIDTPRAASLWGNLIKTTETESSEAIHLAGKLRNLRSEKLDNFVLHGEKSLKGSIDGDETLWKQLCEAARNQSKAESRYKQSTAISAKARERVRSVDSEHKQSPMKVHKHVTKSLANMFSILPDGGEQAMRILAPGARASFAQRSLEEADEKESKGRQILDSAVEATSRSMDMYQSHAQVLIEKYEEEDRVGWDDFSLSLELFIGFLKKFRDQLSDNLASLDTGRPSDAWLFLAESMNTWTITTRQNLEEKFASLSNGGDESPEMGFTLTLLIEPSESVVRVLSMREGASEGAVPDEDADMDEDDIDSDGADADGSASNGRDEPQTSESTESQKDDYLAAGWLLRSLSATNADTPDPLKGKFRNRILGRNRKIGHVDTETYIFASYFWPEAVDPRSIPAVIDSFFCSYGDLGRRLPTLYGRMFVSDVRLIFTSWTGKKYNVKLADISGVELHRGPLSAMEDSLTILSINKGSAEDTIVRLGGFYERQKVVDLLERARAKAKAVAEATINESPSAESAVDSVPEDSTLQKMHVAFSKVLKNISIQRFYEIVWSEGQATTEKPLYGPWLAKGCFDIEVGDWEMMDSVGPWCKENYSQRRIVKFKVKRRTHLYIGPPIANVTQIHNCRVEGNDKCVVSITVELEGIPYSDCFTVEQRWVARREGSSDICVEAGVFVDFRKSTFLKKQISQGTIEEATPSLVDLFETIKEACVAAGGEAVASVEVVKEAVITPKELEAEGDGLFKLLRADQKALMACGGLLLVLYYLWRFYFTRKVPAVQNTSLPVSQSDLLTLGRRLDQLETDIRFVQSTLNEILQILQNVHSDKPPSR